MNSTHPLVSVGIPTFNRPDCLMRALDCISRQTYPNLEIIVSDNASPGDETRCVVENCMAQDSRIKYFRQPCNLGSVANFQFVLNSANGEYFMWAADDDWRAPTYIAALLDELQADEDAVLAFCDIAVLDESGKRKSNCYQTYLPFLQHFISDSSLTRQVRFFLQDESYGKACLIFSLLRSSAAKSISFKDIHEHYGFYGGDNLFVFKLLGQGRLRLKNQILIGLTTGNVKHYSTTNDSTLIRKLKSVIWQCNYLLAYLKISVGVVRFSCAMLLPAKVISFYSIRIRSKLTSLK